LIAPAPAQRHRGLRWALKPFRRVRPVGLLTLGFILLVWLLVDRFGNIQPTKLPSISAVASALRDLASSGELFSSVWISLKRLALGFLIGAGLGMVVGLLMASSRWLMDFIRPLFVFFQVIAGIAWIPLAIVWFGLGSAPVVFVVANAVFFIVAINMLVGMQSIPKVLIFSARTLGAGRLRVMREVLLPGALTHLLVGLDTALSFAWRALIAAELVVASNGLGYVTLQASTRFDSATVLAGIIVIGFLSLLMQMLLVPLRHRTVERWGMTRPVAD
jgi:ABC-type nitrate/sulfonate/bicarbonate transport system permease component